MLGLIQGNVLMCGKGRERKRQRICKVSGDGGNEMCRKPAINMENPALLNQSQVLAKKYAGGASGLQV